MAWQARLRSPRVHQMAVDENENCSARNALWRCDIYCKMAILLYIFLVSFDGILARLGCRNPKTSTDYYFAFRALAA